MRRDHYIGGDQKIYMKLKRVKWMTKIIDPLYELLIRVHARSQRTVRQQTPSAVEVGKGRIGTKKKRSLSTAHWTDNPWKIVDRGLFICVIMTGWDGWAVRSLFYDEWSIFDQCVECISFMIFDLDFILAS